MARIARIATLGITSLAALAMAASPALAATTVTPSGAAKLTGSVVASGTTCTTTLTGTVAASGSPLNFTAAAFNCGSLVTIAPQSLPWNGGNVTKVTGAAHNYTVTIANFSIKATSLGLNCFYKGALTGQGYNPGNASAPGGASTASKVVINNTVTKAAGSSFLCPASTSLTANFNFTAGASNAPVVVS